MAEMTLAELAALVGGELEGPGHAVIRGVAPLETAGPDELSFVANPRYLSYLQGTRAAAVLVPPPLRTAVPDGTARVVVPDPHVALHHVLPVFHPEEPRPVGVDPTAAVDPTAVLGEEVSVGAYAVVEAGARVGARSVVGPHAVIGRGCTIGEECVVHAHATLYPGVVLGRRCTVHSGARLGKEGFGFVWLDGAHRRLRHVGRCVLEDDVEVGCNTTIDRGSVADTVVGAGTKIDNLVHLGHNVRVGRHSMIIAQVGVSGSTTVGEGVVLAGQAGVGGHLTIGDGARIGGQAGVTADVPPGETYSGYPARPHREALRAQGALFRLPELVRRVRELERQLAEATGRPENREP